MTRNEPPSSRSVRRRRPLFATAAGAGALAIAVAILVAVIALLPKSVPAPSPSPAATCAPPGASGPCASPSVAPTASATAAASPSAVPQSPMPGSAFISYVVQPGDSLTSIARTFRTTPRSLAWWNRGTYPTLDPESVGYDPNHVQLNWTLVLIPGVVVTDAAHPSPSPGGPTSSLGPTGTPTIGPSPSPTPSRTQ